jgi:hypothetical protein
MRHCSQHYAAIHSDRFTIKYKLRSVKRILPAASVRSRTVLTHSPHTSEPDFRKEKWTHEVAHVGGVSPNIPWSTPYPMRSIPTAKPESLSASQKNPHALMELDSGQSSWLQIQRSGFDSRHCHIIWKVVCLKRGPLSLVSTTEELLERNSSGSGLENCDYDRRDLSRWPRGTLYNQKLVLRRQAAVARSV